jgi:hypothetical protein
MDIGNLLGGAQGGGLLGLLGGGGGGGGGNLITAFAAELGKAAGAITKEIPFGEYLGPTGPEKLLGIENGPASMLGGIVEDNTDKLPALLSIVGGVVGAYYGNPQAGAEIGNMAGGVLGAFTDASSDAGGPLDLDGKES